MLYILPPPTNPSPPSVWDLIINFHQKGCQDTTVTETSSKPIRFDKGHNGIKRIRHQSWCKSSESSSTYQSHVR